MNDKTTRPVHSVRFGKIQASIWQNESKHGPRFNVTVCRRYLEDGKWKSSDSFNRTEILTLSKALQEAHSWIFAQRKTNELEEGAAEE
jgi:hypothetical protein